MKRLQCWFYGHRYRVTDAYDHTGEPWRWVPVTSCVRCGKVGT